MGYALKSTVVFVADAGKESGLGHVSRSSAVAVALRCRGIEVRCFAHGTSKVIERDGLRWLPLPEPLSLPDALRGDVLVLDSYRLGPDTLLEPSWPTPLVVLHEHDGAPERAALVVSTSPAPDTHPRRALRGLAYACLRPAFWGLPRRELRDPVDRVLVTTGGGDLGGSSARVAQAAQRALPGTHVVVVRGPYATFDVPDDIEVADAPDSLLDHLLAADLVVCAAGQTLLEATATGAPCIVLPLAENQRGHARLITERGLARLADPARPETLERALRQLSTHPAARREMSRRAQTAVDGYGAFRVAFQVAGLVADARSASIASAGGT